MRPPGAIAIALAAGLAAALAPLFAHECPVLSPGGSCSQVYRVHAAEAPGATFNLLVLGAGFAEADLSHFRCAVERMTSRLLTIPPYSRYACHLNIFRMDLVSPSGESGLPAGECSTECEVAPTAPYENWRCEEPVAAGEPLYPDSTASCGRIDLRARSCADGRTCALMYADLAGRMTVAELSTCVGDVNAVLVLANSGLYTGGAFLDQDPPVAFATLHGIDQAYEWQLTAHELGHALFELHDEYTGSGSGFCPYRPHRNVVRGTDLAAGVPYPWDGACEPCETICTFEAACPPGAGCGNGEPCCTEPPGAVPAGFVGLVEGACYNDCGYYKASDVCKMANVNEPYCAGCLASTRAFLASRNIAACEPPRRPGGVRRTDR
ncbi:MAG: M64 family metallopeptidase [Acidobacteriota bacterium]